MIPTIIALMEKVEALEKKVEALEKNSHKPQPIVTWQEFHEFIEGIGIRLDALERIVNARP